MDELNRRIVSHLLRDGRATFHAVGASVGLSSSAVKRRVDRMVAEKKIAGFVAVIDPAALGWDTEAYVEIYYTGNVPTSKLRRDLEAIPEVVGVWTVSGEADALVHVVAQGMSQIEEAVERMRECSGVERTKSAIVMSRILSRPRA